MHAISGCDTVSSFYGIGKRTAWAVWRSMPHLNPIFVRLSRAPCQISSNNMDAVERHVVLLYQRTSTLSHVNEERKQMFAFGNCKIENIPPTLHALEQRVKRAVYQVGHIWRQPLSGEPHVPSPDLWGWERVSDDSQWDPMLDYSSKAAKRIAQTDASVSKPVSGAHSCASVLDNVTENKITHLRYLQKQMYGISMHGHRMRG